MNLQAQRDISRKPKVFGHASTSGNIAFTCRHFGISRDTFYQWNVKECLIWYSIKEELKT